MMTDTTIKYLIFGLCLTTLFLTACRPPMKCVENKSKYFKSTRTKNSKKIAGKINTTGTFISLDTTCDRRTFSMIKLNSDQTVQVSRYRENIISRLNLDNDSYLYYLDQEVSYYYYIDEKKQTLILEGFEYWDAPWWNFFVTTNHYLVEKFTIKGDTLINHKTDRFSVFGRQYLLNKNLIKNFNQVGNKYIKQHK